MLDFSESSIHWCRLLYFAQVTWSSEWEMLNKDDVNTPQSANAKCIHSNRSYLTYISMILYIERICPVQYI